MANERYLVYRGERRSLSEWSRVAGLSPKTLRSRLERSGWALDRALTTPPMARSQCGVMGRRRSTWG